MSTKELCLLAASAVMFTLPGAATGQSAPWLRVAASVDDERVELAVNDYRRFIGQATGAVPERLDAQAWRESGRPAVALALDAQTREALGEQGYRLEQRAGSVVITGAAPMGLVNGVYGLLRELGFRFYLGSDAIPEELPPALPQSPIERTPTLTMRGVLPWYNFFNSPTTWDIEDHRAFADQLIRSGANFLGFHTYDSEPFAGYVEDGEVKWGGRLLNTATPTWGTHPLKTDAFGYGTGRLFAHDHFGASTTRLEGETATIVPMEQKVMRAALDYAKRRGLTTCIGFEMNGDPTQAPMREAFLKRFNHVLDRYPGVDLIWLWQSETQGVQGFATSYNQHVLPYALSPESPLRNYALWRWEAFDWVINEARGAVPFYQDTPAGEMARAAEGARLEQFAKLALAALEQRKDAPRLAISGWGGDDRLLSADYYPGLDRLLPDSVVFTSLDHIHPRERVDRTYHMLPPERERWPIVWLENDGDEWRPQPFVHVYEEAVRDTLQGGSQGILGIHWRSREVEDNLAYLVDFAWNPALTAGEYFEDKAEACFDSAIAEEMGPILTALDASGYLWVGGTGQNECAPFTWGAPDRAKFEALKELREEVRGLLPRATRGRQRLQWLLARMDWVVAYGETQFAVLEARNLVSEAKMAGTNREKRERAQAALARLREAPLGDALWDYARRLSTRGEYGVLATINTKAVVAWRELMTEAAQLAGTAPPEEAAGWTGEPQVVVPRYWGTASALEPLVLEPVVLGGGELTCRYRPLGAEAWTSVACEKLSGWVRRATIPAEHLQEPGIEAAFDIGGAPAYGPFTVTVAAIPEPRVTPVPAVAPAIPKRFRITATEGDRVTSVVEWDDLPGVDFYRVYRDGELACETAVSAFPDFPEQRESTYRVEAVRAGDLVAESNELRFQAPERAPKQAVEVRAALRPDHVRVIWSALQSPNVTSYRLERRGAGASPWKEVAVKDAATAGWMSYADRPEPGEWAYRVTPLSATGLEGPPAEASVDFQPGLAEEPVLDLPLTERPAEAEVVGEVGFSDEGARFGAGYLELPHRPGFEVGRAMTLAFEFKADRVGEMSVLLSHGGYSVNGWFAQILSGRLLIRMRDGDGQGAVIQPGAWYEAVFVYDGVRPFVRINGEWIPQRGQPVSTVDTSVPLRIGTYQHDEPPYRFHGLLKNVRIYDGIAVELPE